jgi:trk/ktr system potassium uptake protein
MRIIVIGGAGLAEQVATALARGGDEVTVVDTDPGREAALAAAGLRAVPGDPAVPATLEAAGARLADVLIAATRSDAVNLVAALLAKKHFSVSRVIGRVNEPANEELFGPAWGVDALVSPSSSVVALVRTASSG